MDDFTYDIIEKKRIASGARHKVNGSKSKFVSLPSDNLTHAQKRKLNGPVRKFNIDAPMSWEEFKALDHDQKCLYISHIQQTYSASVTMLAKMFKVTHRSVTNHFETHEIPYQKGHYGGPHQPPEVYKKWKVFCNGVIGGTPTIKDTPTTPESNNSEMGARPITYASPELPNGIARFSIYVRGINSWEELYDYLKQFPCVEDASVDISICARRPYMPERTIFDQINEVKDLIKRNQQLLYSFQDVIGSDSTLARERETTLKALECYLDILESTVNARARQDSRENSSP